MPAPHLDGAAHAPDSPESTPPAWLAYGCLGLSLRESEVLWWVSQGKRDREIALLLGISLRTVNRHMCSILERLGVENRAAALTHLHRHFPPLPSDGA